MRMRSQKLLQETPKTYKHFQKLQNKSDIQKLTAIISKFTRKEMRGNTPITKDCNSNEISWNKPSQGSKRYL